jgi:hypothetical protein
MQVGGIDVRKFAIAVEEIFHEGGAARGDAAADGIDRGRDPQPVRGPPRARHPPAVGQAPPARPRDVDAPAGRARRRQARIEGFGKGAIVGTAGELEHGALWHVPGGYAMRDLLGEAKAIVPSTKKIGGPGARLDIP